MNLIDKHNPPASFQQYKYMEGSCFDEMDRIPYREDLENSLLDEQGYLCAYCQQRIKLPIKIEHHCEQSICNGENGTIDKRLDYNNLFAVCWGNENTKRDFTCDKLKSVISSIPSKQRRFLPMTIKPTVAAHIATISYSSTGMIRSSLYDLELNQVLGLNETFLKEKRKKLWKQLLKNCSRNTVINKSKLKRTLEGLLERPYRNEFPGMLDYMLKVFAN